MKSRRTPRWQHHLNTLANLLRDEERLSLVRCKLLDEGCCPCCLDDAAGPRWQDVMDKQCRRATQLHAEGVRHELVAEWRWPT